MKGVAKLCASGLSTEIFVALRQLHDRLEQLVGTWLVGGSCSLALQQVQLAAHPRDLDVYADRDDASLIDQQLFDHACDRPHYSETSIYRSVLSHYMLAGIEIELVGGFTVSSGGSRYEVAVRQHMNSHAVQHTIDGRVYRLMPLAHELVFNLLRQRDDRCTAIAAVMREQTDLHLPALHTILANSSISTGHRRQLKQLLGTDLVAI